MPALVGISPFIFIYSLLVGLLFLFLVIGLIRKKLLRINYSILWIGVTCALLFFVLRYEWVRSMGEVFGLGAPKNLFFFISIFFLFAICIQFSIIISMLVLKVKNLGQRVAIMDLELKQLREAGAKEDPRADSHLFFTSAAESKSSDIL